MHHARDDTQAVATGMPGKSSIRCLEQVIDSITSIAAFETEALKQGRQFDIGTMNMRKVRLLLDLNSAMRTVDVNQANAHLKDNLRRMHLVLSQNLSQFHAHATAIREVVNMIIETALAQQDDGTYSSTMPY